MQIKTTLLALTSVLFINACSDKPADKSNESASTQAINNDVQAKPAVDNYLNGWLQKSFASESEKANDFFERVFQEHVQRNPETQTVLGIKTDYDKWNDISDARAKEDNELLKEHLKRLQKHVDFDKLDAQTKLSYRLFMDSAQTQIDMFKYRFHNYPVNQMRGLQSGMPAFMINMHRVSDEKDALAYIKRLQTVNKKFKTLNYNLKVRAEKGILPPKFVYPYVIKDSQNILKGQPFDNSEQDSTLLADFKKKVSALDIEQGEKEKLIEAAKTALITSVKPAYESLIETTRWIESQANDDDGAWKFPDGEAFFNAALKQTTSTELTADEIHKIGLFEVERIHNEMREIMKKVGFTGTLQEFFQFMRTDKRFYKENTDEGRAEYLAENIAVIDSMKSKLDQLFLTKPKADIEVKAVEKFREQSAGKAFYNAPSLDGSRPGIYYANLYRMEDMPTYQMEALAYHEGIPGHHMQRAISIELKDIPKFRKFARYTAYTEGWGLYSEYLPKDVGAYSDPYSDFGRLAMELWRSCRLVVDTGIHAKKWTRQQGIDYYTQNTPNPEGDAIKMVERHIVMPSQATAYKIGMLKILELRKKAQTKLGRLFDIREFHDVIITSGPVPLNILEELVDDWIASKNQIQEQ